MSTPKQPHLNGAYYGPSIPPPSKTYHRPGHGGSSCDPCGCLCGCIFSLICKLLLTVIFTVGLAAFILWLVLRPNKVKFHVTGADLSQFDLNTTTTTTTLFYNLDLNMTIRNPNKRIGIYYDSIEARAFYRGQRFAVETVPSFYQGKKNTTDLSVRFSGQNIVVVQGDVLSAYNSEKGSGIYNIDMKLYLRTRLKYSWFKTPRFKPKIKCELSVPLDSNVKSSTTFQTTSCGLDW